jgi:hypothetical protein
VAHAPRFELAYLIFATLVLSRSLARAEPAKFDSAQRLQIELAGADSDIALLERRLVDALRRPGLAFEIDRVDRIEPDEVVKPAAIPVFARMFVDLASPHEATLYLADDRRDRIFVRSLSLPRGFDEVAAEQLLFVAKGSIDAILSGENIGVERKAYHSEESAKAAPPPPAEHPPIAPPREPLRSARMFGGYAVAMMGEGVVGQGPVLGARIEEAHFSLGLAIQGRLPVQVGNDELNLRLTEVGGRLSVAGWLSATSTFRFVLSGAVGADLVHVEPRHTDTAGARPYASFWATDAVGNATLAVEYRMRNLSLAVLSGVELGFTEVKYVLENSSDLAPIFAPLRVRPLVGIEIGAPLSF